MSAVSVISVVDADSSVRAATSKFLRSHGYTVQAYSSAEHFLQSGRLNDTLCVIADLQMPGMSGLELLTMMRAQGAVVGNTVFLPVAEAAAVYAFDVSVPAKPCIKWVYSAKAPLRTSAAFGVISTPGRMSRALVSSAAVASTPAS